MDAEVFGLGGVFLVLGLASLVVALWALVDAAVRPKMAFEVAGQSKVLWVVLPIVGIFFFSVVGGILGVVYLTAIRPKIRSAQRY